MGGHNISIWNTRCRTIPKVYIIWIKSNNLFFFLCGLSGGRMPQDQPPPLLSSNTFTTLQSSLSRANSIGFLCLLSFTSLSAPLSSRILTIRLLPLITDRCNGVRPSSSPTFKGTFKERRKLTAFSEDRKHAQWRGEPF